ncbi:MAG: hypothetical protein MO852_01240 [Candidatus Devosia euplotis]|nr:hypothetical protein [Candidatus Devosia euplotis]
MQVRNRSTDYDDCLVLVALREVPGQRRDSRRRLDASGLDEYALSPQQCLGVGAGVTKVGGNGGIGSGA